MLSNFKLGQKATVIEKTVKTGQHGEIKIPGPNNAQRSNLRGLNKRTAICEGVNCTGLCQDRRN